MALNHLAIAVIDHPARVLVARQHPLGHVRQERRLVLQAGAPPSQPPRKPSGARSSRPRSAEERALTKWRGWPRGGVLGGCR